MRTRTLFAVCFLLVILPCFGVDEQNPSLRTATNSFGMSVAVWHEKVECTDQVFAQRQGVDGKPMGPVIRVVEDDWFDHWSPTVAIDDAGNFVVVWEKLNHSEASDDVYLRRFDSNDNPGEIFRITYKGVYSGACAVGLAMSPSGKFVICWLEFDLVPVEGEPGHRRTDNFRLWLQQFAPDCSPFGPPLALTEAVPRRNKSSSPGDIFSGISATEQEITIQFRKSLFEPVITETLYWLDVKPFVTLRYQQKENPGDFVSLTISPTLTGKKYAVYYCDSLENNCWSPLGEPVIAESNSLTVIDNGGAASSPLRETKSRFYRVCLVP